MAVRLTPDKGNRRMPVSISCDHVRAQSLRRFNRLTRYISKNEGERRPWIEMLVRLIPFGSYEPIRVLEIGAGHGALTQAILESFPRSHVVCQDFPKTFFAHARQHLKLQYGDRVSCLDSDISRRGWDHEALGPFDTIVSALAINKAERAQRIPVLYNEIFCLLRNGGCFFKWDAVAQLESSSPAPPSLVSHLFWLRRAGFSDLFFWTEKEQAVFGGYRFEVEG